MENERNLTQLISAVKTLLQTRPMLIIGLDGRCGAGKTTLGRALAAHFDGNLFAVDDFFLRPEQRTEARLAEIGGNFDRERLLDEVFSPLISLRKNAGGRMEEPVEICTRGCPSPLFSYAPYSCRERSLLPPRTVYARRINIIEGSYALHPALREYYDLSVFLDIPPEEQRRRILAREGERAREFFGKWIPKEEAYFRAFGIREVADILLENTSCGSKIASNCL